MIRQLQVVENALENCFLKAFGALYAAAKHAGLLRMATGHSGKRGKSTEVEVDKTAGGNVGTPRFLMTFYHKAAREFKVLFFHTLHAGINTNI